MAVDGKRSWRAWLVDRLRPVFPPGMIETCAQWIRRYVPDPEFRIFSDLADARGLVLDVGANQGHTAITVLRQTRRLKVVSIEPNVDYRWALRLIAVLHPWRFRFRVFAAGRDHGQATLYVPGARKSGLATQASLDAAEFEVPFVRERLAEEGFDASDSAAFRRLDVRVLPLDALGLSPAMVKIDVEGYESQVLAGMAGTLARCRPALIIEKNHPERWLPRLEALGYSFFTYETGTGRLRVFDQNSMDANLYCLHEHNETELTQRLLQLVTTNSNQRLN